MSTVLISPLWVSGTSEICLFFSESPIKRKVLFFEEHHKEEENPENPELRNCH